MKKAQLTLLILAISYNVAHSQICKTDSSYRRCFIGSTFFMVANLLPDPPSFYQLNFGYRITPKDVISIEAMTWTYRAPLGIPQGSSSHGKPESEYPGSVKSIGIGVAYQRFIWKNFYSSLHALPLIQNYLDSENKKIQNGFQLFCTLRFGYHIKLFKNRFFLEPSIAFTAWPINNNLPESFTVEENKWPKYFLLEPGLHFGINF